MRKIFLLLSTMAVTLAVTAMPAQAAPNPRVFVSIPDQMPGNVVSWGFEATQTDELGDQIRLAPGKRALKTVTVVMSSWACQSGTGSADCTTTPGAKFPESVTLTLYRVHPTDANLHGAVITSKTKTFSMPYRPSANPTECGPGATQWFSSADDDCYNGKAFTISFNFARPNLVLPNELIYGVSYDTSTSGNTPHGVRGCQSTTGGCPDDSLNVGIEAGLPKRGTDVYPNGGFIDQAGTSSCEEPSVPDVFSLENGVVEDCWQGYNPMVRFVVKG